MTSKICSRTKLVRQDPLASCSDFSQFAELCANNCSQTFANVRTSATSVFVERVSLVRYVRKERKYTGSERLRGHCHRTIGKHVTANDFVCVTTKNEKSFHLPHYCALRFSWL